MALETLHSDEGIRFQRLEVRRKAVTAPQKVVGALYSSEINVISFDPSRFDFRTSYKQGFEPTTASERSEAEGLTFALNANFFGPDGKPLGWVVSGGKQVNSQYRNWSGFFFVKAGKAVFWSKVSPR